MLAAAREASEPESLEGVGGAAGDEDGGRAVDVSAIGPPDGVADDKAEDPAVDVGPDGAGEEVAVRIGQAVLKALESGGGLEQLMAAHQAVAAFHGNNYLPLLEAFYRSHRAVLFTLVDAIELEATSAERGVLDALEFIRAVRHRRGEWIEETVVDRGNEQVRVSIDINAFASEMWKRTLRDKRRPGMLARRHLEVCVFSYLAAELRSGDLAVAGSDSYANLHAQMMTGEECEAEVAGFCEQAGSPPTRRRWSRSARRSSPRPPRLSMRATRRTPTCVWRAASRCWPAQGRRPASVGVHTGGRDPGAAAGS